MSRLHFGFDSPVYLLLLCVLLPAVWLLGRKSLAGLGPMRGTISLVLRSTVVVLLVCALAELQLLKSTEKVTVIYLLDQSRSIPLSKRQAMLDYVMREVARHRRAYREDRAGVIVFGRSANIEVPPFDEDIASLEGIEAYVNLRTDATNLESALKLAKASFPEDGAKRIVVVSDGNENLGNARSAASGLAEDGIGIDAVPVRLETRAEVAVEKVSVPPEVRQGQPVEVRVVLDNQADRSIQGKVRLSRRIGSRAELLGEQDVQLKPGKNVFTFSHKIDEVAVYTYSADFVPVDNRDDAVSDNNRATAFTQVRGKGRVLLIENWQTPGEFDHLADRLRRNQIDVTMQRTDQLFSSLAELQAYDAVILGNVPRSSGDDTQSIHSFSDAQISMLVRNTEQMGCGLLMIGGANGFGAGGWSNTDLEKAMPVDFQIRNERVRAIGALALLMHASELSEGNYWQKEVAKQAIQALGPMDYCGLLHWDGGVMRWLWRDDSGRGMTRVGERRNLMLSRVGKMTPGDMPEFDPGLKLSLSELTRLPASTKLAIVISDGDPSAPLPATVAAFKDARIQISTVAIGAHGPAGHKTLQDLAAQTGGRYFVVTDPRLLPKIYVSEVRRVARPLVYEPLSPVRPRVVYSHDILEGIDGPLPPVSGFVLTSVKENPLVEVAAISPEPAETRNATILAAWTYGLGRTAVLTTDAGKKWASDWTSWQNYDKFFTQLVRWTMRPVDERGKFTVATDSRDGKVRVVVTALDKDDQFLNFLNLSATGVDPELQSFDVKVSQVAPGRYVGEFEATKEGSYFLSVNPGPGYAPLLSGVSVPYSAEFRDRETNQGLLESLAWVRPAGGQPGAVIDGDVRSNRVDALLNVDTFRGGLAPAIRSDDVWPFVLLLSACLFFADVLIRRVTLSGLWWSALWIKIASRWRPAPAETSHDERLGRLRSRKAEVSGEIDDRRAASRFDPGDGTSSVSRGESPVISAEVGPVRPTDQPVEPKRGIAPEAAGTSYTERLLKAKRQAWKDEGKTPPEQS